MIANTVDGSFPQGADWQRQLLQQMALEIKPTRPAVLSTKTLKSLDEYLRFRHVVRNLYAYEFDPERVKVLAQNIGSVYRALYEDLNTYALFLDEQAKHSD